jgi:hypothetical protein
MKNFIIYFSLTIAGFFALCFSFLSLTKDVDNSKDYFFESGDSVIAKVNFSGSRMYIEENSENGFYGRLRKDIKISNDSVYIEETDFTERDKYGKSELVRKLIFLCTYDEKGIANQKEFLRAANKIQFIGNDSLSYTKVTILDNGSVSLY